MTRDNFFKGVFLLKQRNEVVGHLEKFFLMLHDMTVYLFADGNNPIEKKQMMV